MSETQPTPPVPTVEKSPQEKIHQAQEKLTKFLEGADRIGHPNLMVARDYGEFLLLQDRERLAGQVFSEVSQNNKLAQTVAEVVFLSELGASKAITAFEVRRMDMIIDDRRNTIEGYEEAYIEVIAISNDLLNAHKTKDDPGMRETGRDFINSAWDRKREITEAKIK